MKKALNELMAGNGEDSFSQINRRLSEIEKTQANQSQRIEAYALVIERAIRGALRMARSAQALRTWTFDARMANTVFENVGLPHKGQNGKIERWVTGRHAIVGEIDVPRGTQYRLDIEVSAFGSEAASETFSAKADDLTLPWLLSDDNVYSTIVPTSPRDILRLEIGIAPAAVDLGQGSAFAFRSITLTAQ